MAREFVALELAVLESVEVEHSIPLAKARRVSARQAPEHSVRARVHPIRHLWAELVNYAWAPEM